ncbi:MAG: hypothetical protein AW10_04098 [Candidatus Accumulibacter appositus]|uniref:Uncharacterized protein n=1 Tax=Candidatus Accumulibacter appositus TaxID=1454003 RepID=A0A011NNY8_9PROT|nr:MAG: hypothetical protein AW10_04098 [Candidatus Accumulibacter appositus]
MLKLTAAHRPAAKHWNRGSSHFRERLSAAIDEEWRLLFDDDPGGDHTRFTSPT